MSGRLWYLLLRTLDRLPRLRRAVTAPHLITGRQGEEAASFHLRRQGYTVVARNWRSPRRHGELDLVAWDGPVLCFVEVKTRSSRQVATAESALDAAKLDELRGVAREYLRRLQPAPAYRFDVVSVYRDPGGRNITLYKNAFPMS
jgi:putative endonuclease